jgi:hypothetical protein
MTSLTIRSREAIRVIRSVNNNNDDDDDESIELSDLLLSFNNNVLCVGCCVGASIEKKSRL